jgi:hypothetical protein
MNILGFGFNKIYVERFSKKVEKLQVGYNFNVTDLKLSDDNLIKIKEDVFIVKFEFNVQYDPDFAKIELGGEMVVSVEPKLSKEVIKKWKNKELTDDFRVFVFNHILKKSTLKALELEDQMNLPNHIPLPSVQKADKK